LATSAIYQPVLHKLQKFKYNILTIGDNIVVCSFLTMSDDQEPS